MARKEMRIAAFSDWRVQPIEPLIELFNVEKADVILFGGDDTARLISFILS